MTTNAFITNMRKTLEEKKGSGLSAIAPAATEPVASVEGVSEIKPSVETTSSEKKCMLTCIPAQPKSGKDICLPLYEDGTKKVLRMGIRLSAAPDNVPCAYYHNKNRLNMGVTMMHALSESGEVVNIPYNVKDKAKQDALKVVRDAVKTAFAAHQWDEDLTHVRLLTLAGLYDGATKLLINYQTYERLINELLGAPAPPVAPRRKRTTSTESNGSTKDAAVEEDEDDAFIAGPKKRRLDDDGTIDPDLLDAANDLNFSEEEEEVIEIPPPVQMPVEAAPSKKKMTVNVQNMDVQFVKSKLFSILQNYNQNDLSLWDALQSESLDSFFIFKLEQELAIQKRDISRDYLMAALFSKMRQAANKSDLELWEFTNRILGL